MGTFGFVALKTFLFPLPVIKEKSFLRKRNENQMYKKRRESVLCVFYHFF